MSWKSTRCLTIIALFLLMLPQGCSDSDSDDSANEKYIEAYTLGTQAYIWGYPVVSNYNRFRVFSMFTEIDVKNKTLPRAPVNQICFLSDYVTPDERSIVAPNHDTIYGSAWLDLSIEPIVLRMPDMGSRFWIFEMCDFYTDVFASPGTLHGSSAGNYLIVGPDWNGAAPEGMVEVIRAPTHRVYLLPRILLRENPEDLAEVRELINQITICPLSEIDTAPTYIDYAGVPQIEEPDWVPEWTPDDTFWETLHAAIQATEIRPGEEAKVASFLDILSNRDDPDIRKGLDDALADSKQDVINAGSFSNLGDPVGNGWTLLTTGGRFGTDYLTRAGAAYSFIYYNLLEDSAYYMQTVDESGDLLDGSRNYRIHFDASDLPPYGENAFWSVTLYDSEFFLFANEFNRYNIGTVTEGLEFNDDGSLDLYLQAAIPEGHESNWLPTPSNGNFELTLRVYIPGPSILDGTYLPPPVMRLP